MKRKKTLFIILSLVMVIGLTSISAFASDRRDIFLPVVTEEFILPNNIVIPMSGDAVLTITDREILDEIVRLNNMVSPDGVATLQKVVFVPSEYNFIDELPELRFDIYSIMNPTPRPHRSHHFPATMRTYTLINHSSFYTSLTAGTSISATSSQTNTIGLSAGNVISSSVGFTIGTTITNSGSITVQNVAPGATAFVDASLYAHVVDFCIYRLGFLGINWNRVGSGTAQRADGVRFFVWQ